MICILGMNSFRNSVFIPTIFSSVSKQRMCSLCNNSATSNINNENCKRYYSTCFNTLLLNEKKRKRNTKRHKNLVELLEVSGGSVREKMTVVKKCNSKDLSMLANISGVISDKEGLTKSEVVDEILEELEHIQYEDQQELEKLVNEIRPECFETVNTRKGKSISKEDRELMAKIKLSELEKAGKEKSLKQNLASYLELCVNCGLLNQGFNTLKYYLHRKSDIKITDVNVFDRLFDGFARKGDFDKFMEVWKLMEKNHIKAAESSFAFRLECIARSRKQRTLSEIKSTIDDMHNQRMSCQDLFEKCQWRGNSREMVLIAIRMVEPKFNPSVQLPYLFYTCPLLSELNTAGVRKLCSPAKNLFKCNDLEAKYEEQIQMELSSYINVKSIEKTQEPTEVVLNYRKKLEEFEAKWSESIIQALDRDLTSMKNMQKNILLSSKQINIYPYLVVLEKEEYKNIIMKEIRKLAEGSETYSASIGQLYRDLGNQVRLRYEMKFKSDTGVLDKVKKMYKEYLEWYVNPRISKSVNSRQHWQVLMHQNQGGPTIDSENIIWTSSALFAIGKFLYNIILRDVKIDVNVFRSNQSPHFLPGFYPVFRNQGHVLKEELKPHPILSRLFRCSCLPYLSFSVSELPMVVPPRPWTSINSGGYIVAKTNIVRLPHQAVQQLERLKETPESQLYPLFDSLNQLSSVPWKVNKKVLDVVVEVFNSGGCSKLDIPEPPSACILTDQCASFPGKSEKYQAYRKRMMLRRRRAEMYSLWCDALYRLSLANHFKERVFWLPHNMDFRGRVYPCPPHLNHLGSDMARSLLIFAKGQPLGPKGLDWLKVHLVNLTGLKKKESIEDRLKYANELMPEILDSAEKPLTGNKWWWSSEEPWQTLASCIEIKQALECPEGTDSYVCHFPVHQDGSCNGLQHYAALGRDKAGAESVNLSPASLPQDVYSCVSALVEKERITDAENGIAVAKVLEGFVKRKVIKQTVMTTVYGVTRFGARLQIAKQLKDIEEFPKEYVWQASSYLVSKTFASLRQMFSSAREIQDWFTESARMIAQVCGQNVEYLTPLGLPVVQPYFKFKPVDFKKTSSGKINECYPMDMFERPNVLKQKNAFPPNFIHSLDSTHMMLTSLHCEREGINFVSVHDCYWTHPSSVHIMNKICREQFVSLHSQPILKDLSNFLLKKYGYSDESLYGDPVSIIGSKRKLNSLLAQLPSTGDFNLNNVIHSVYFFS